jgi:SAM-dependent methyltransferase
LEIKNFFYCDVSSLNIEKSQLIIQELREKNYNSIQVPENVFGLKINHEKWPFKEDSVDCIVNNLSLHNVNSLEQTLISYNESLKPDGCFIGNFPLI